jgi:hypothetical protein
MFRSVCRRQTARKTEIRVSVEDTEERWEICPGAEPFAVMSWHGRLLGRFDDQERALDCFRRWPAAASVIFAGTHILAVKDQPDDDGHRLSVVPAPQRKAVAA